MRISAIWHARPAGTLAARHGMDGTAYQNEWSKWRQAGFLTQGVTGYGAGNGARYAAFWRK